MRQVPLLAVGVTLLASQAGSCYGQSTYGRAPSGSRIDPIYTKSSDSARPAGELYDPIYVRIKSSAGGLDVNASKGDVMMFLVLGVLLTVVILQQAKTNQTLGELHSTIKTQSGGRVVNDLEQGAPTAAWAAVDGAFNLD